mgnify:FL=1
MKRFLYHMILAAAVCMGFNACETVDHSGEIDGYRKLEIIDRTVLPEILSHEWFLKGAGFTEPFIYENSFSFRDKAEIPLKSFKGDNDNELTFNFTKNFPATFATYEYEGGGGYTSTYCNKSSYNVHCNWHVIGGFSFKAKFPRVTEILYFPDSNDPDTLINSWISYYGKDENHVTKIVIKSRCSHVDGYPIIDSGFLYMVFERS